MRAVGETINSAADLVRKTLEPIVVVTHNAYTHTRTTHTDMGSSNARQTNHQSSDADRGKVKVKGVAGGSSGLAIKEATLIIDVCLRPKLGLPAPPTSSYSTPTGSKRLTPV